MTQVESVTRDLVDWAMRVQLTDIPPEVLVEARRGLLDGIGVAVKGAVSLEWEALARALGVVDGAASPSGATTRVLGRPLVAEPVKAALLNGTAAMSLELDDGYSQGGSHPTPPVLAAIIAAGREVTFDRVLVAYVVGCEVVCRVSRAGHPEALGRGFHITPVAGVVGATVANAIARDIASDRVLDAVGISGSFAGGLFEFMEGGASVKRIHAGKAASDGVLAIDLALGGITGPPTVLEGRNGLLRAFSGATDERIATITAGLGSEWAFMDRYMKIYPCARHSHGPVDIVLDLIDRHGLTHDDVADIAVETYTIALKIAHFGDSTTLDAQMSMPYAIAAAMVHKRLDLKEFEQSARSDTRVRDLAARISFAADWAMDELYPVRRPARVTITTLRGERFVGEVEGPYGEPYRPIPDARLRAKFHALCDSVVGVARADAALGLLVSEFLDRHGFEHALDELTLM